MEQKAEIIQPTLVSHLENKILRSALTENERALAKKLAEVGGKEKIGQIIHNSLNLMLELEAAARHPKEHLPKTAQEAGRIIALWDISAPGTWFEPEKLDRYKGLSYTLWEDRRRLAFTGGLARHIAEVRLGHKLTNPQMAKIAIWETGPHVIYNGRPDENAAVRQAIEQRQLILPIGKVLLIDKTPEGKRVDSTVDQVRSFRLPAELHHKEGELIGIVVSAPQAVRVLHMLEKFQTFPPGVKAKIFPVPTRDSGIPEYYEKEIRGILYYAFVQDPPVAAEKPYPFEI